MNSLSPFTVLIEGEQASSRRPGCYTVLFTVFMQICINDLAWPHWLPCQPVFVPNDTVVYLTGVTDKANLGLNTESHIFEGNKINKMFGFSLLVFLLEISFYLVNICWMGVISQFSGSNPGQTFLVRSLLVLPVSVCVCLSICALQLTGNCFLCLCSVCAGIGTTDPCNTTEYKAS